jgi:hypothetical protein
MNYSYQILFKYLLNSRERFGLDYIISHHITNERFIAKFHSNILFIPNQFRYDCTAKDHIPKEQFVTKFYWNILLHLLHRFALDYRTEDQTTREQFVIYFYENICFYSKHIFLTWADDRISHEQWNIHTKILLKYFPELKAVL